MAEENNELVFNDILTRNEANKQRLIDGKYNCLPFPFKRFRRIYPGFERGKFIILTANQKVGKSKLADYLFVYEPLFQMMEHPELRVKVLYFTLEIAADEKINEFMCHLLFRLDKIHIDTRTLKNVDRQCDSKIYGLLRDERHQKYLRAFKSMVTYRDDVKNPTGINKICRDAALKHGHLNYITYDTVDEITGEPTKGKAIDPLNQYTPDDPEEYRIIILDNAANLTPESGLSKAETIEKMAKYGNTLRNQFKYIFVLIQHQAQAQEGVENIKLGRMRPTSDGLGDCKTTTRDINCMIGLYNPIKFLKETKQEMYEGYNIKKLSKHCRFLEIIEDRDYGAGGYQCGLFFDGAVSRFKELPKQDDTEGLENYYRYIKQLETAETAEDLELTNPK
jgi:hypothetical protein